jgi:hypothetical protein
MPMYWAICTTGSPPTKPLLIPNACSNRSPGRNPLAYKARAPSSHQVRTTGAVSPT